MSMKPKVPTAGHVDGAAWLRGADLSRRIARTARGAGDPAGSQLDDAHPGVVPDEGAA